MLLWFVIVTISLIVIPLHAQTNLLVNGDLETIMPNFWNKYNEGAGSSVCSWEPSGAGLHSFKVTKPATSSEATGWMSVNNADLYWNNAKQDQLYNLSAVIKTDGVNTSPANDDEKIGVFFKIYQSGVLLGEQFLEADQTAATKDWHKVTGGIVIGSTEPDSVIAILQVNKDATGTAWFDSVSCGTSPDWSMGLFNGGAEDPVGWLDWYSTSEVGFAGLDSTEARSGLYSALLKERDDNADEMVFYSEPVPADPDTWYKITVWAKWDSINTDDKFLPSNVVTDRDNDRLGMCFFYHSNTPLRQGWSLAQPGDQFYYFDQRDSTGGWTEYTVISKSPADAVGLSCRARFTSFPKGYVWYDDFSIKPVDVLMTGVFDDNPIRIPMNFELSQNYPNPFNPSTSIGFILNRTGDVQLEIFNILGQKVRTLVDAYRKAGAYRVVWDGCDDSGLRVGSGVYIYRLIQDGLVISKRMVMIQ
jgi:hypothetical protein